MVQHASADDLIERLAELPDLLNGKLVEIKIPQAVFTLQTLACGAGWSG